MRNPSWKDEWKVLWGRGEIAYKTRSIKRWECLMCRSVGPWTRSMLRACLGWGGHIDKHHMMAPMHIPKT